MKFSNAENRTDATQLDTITGLIAAELRLAVRKINISDEKWPKAMRYVNRAMS